MEEKKFNPKAAFSLPMFCEILPRMFRLPGMETVCTELPSKIWLFVVHVILFPITIEFVQFEHWATWPIAILELLPIIFELLPRLVFQL